MHIPDGYLSPSTCAVLYAAAIAGWYSALKRLNACCSVAWSRSYRSLPHFRRGHDVQPAVAGRTTGHALGVTISVIVLGPSGAVLAISIALAIQALFFGDGGISTLGANCFNMAIVASLVAYASYRLIAAGATIGSKRRVVAAAIAGYLAVNAAALIAAIEFGIQPALFHDARGMPLYAPYPLSIAVPAMMMGHLTLAGVAEAAISAGLVAYLQAADPGLLRNTAGVLPATETASAITPAATNSLRRLWIAVALLMVLTPLGILVAGKSLGRVVSFRACYAAKRGTSCLCSEEFGRAVGPSCRDAAARQALDRTVSGLCARVRKERAFRLFSFRNVRSRHFAAGLPGGAALGSATTGSEAFLMARGGFLTSTMLGFTRALARAMASEQIARQAGLLQSLDPRVRVVGLFHHGSGSNALAENCRDCRLVPRRGDYRHPVEGWYRNASEASVARRPGLHGSDCFPGDISYSGRSGCCLCRRPGAHYGARCANRYAADRARGNCGDVYVFAGAVHSLDACAQSAARLSPAARGGHDAGHDASVHLPSGGNGGTDV